MTNEEKLAIAIEALSNIANPIGYLKKEADKEGARLNVFAYDLSIDPNFIKNFAIKALEKIK
jgi:hypothetical protein